MDRSAAIHRLKTGGTPFDLLVVGGGATGLGIAIDGASRGYHVALIEQADLGKGTSSRSTKLVHGGVRYLQQGNLSLVLEALRERGRLVRNAPHVVHQTDFVIPCYHGWQKVWYGTGMKLYDRLAGKWGFGASRALSREETLARVATVNAARLCGGVVYRDGQFDDARLAINLAQTADDLKAVVANYCACVGVVKVAGKIRGVRARDGETGDEFEIRARAVVNATGVYVDGIRRLDDATAAPLVTASRGIHLVVPKRFLPGSSALMIPRTSDGRVFFAVPWHDHVVLGTTDVPARDISLEPRSLESERQFVLEHARRYLSSDLAEQDVLSVFAGLRPLVKKRGRVSTAALSRGHHISVSASGLVTITGGKWTTYRQMAEDAVDRAADVANLPRRPSRTRDLAIHGATRAVVPETNLRSYGSDAGGIRGLIHTDPELAAVLHPELPYQRAEVVWHARYEMARTVEDILARRTRALLLNAQASIAAAPAVARLLARELSRDEDWIELQVRDYTALARGYVFADPASLSG